MSHKRLDKLDKDKNNAKASRSSEGNNEATSTRRANVRLAFKCEQCPLSFASNVGLSIHRGQVHRKADKKDEGLKNVKCPYCPCKLATEVGLKCHITVKHKDHTTGDTSMNSSQDQGDMNLSPVTLKCSKCDKRFLNADFLKNHMSTDHPILHCGICGEVFKSKDDMIQHKKSCCAKDKNVAESGENITTAGDADAEEIQVSFARPAAKRALLTKDENRNSNSNDNFADGNQIPVSVNPKRENPNRSVPDVVQEITVKTEPKNTSVDAQFTNPRTHRASTPSVYRSLGQTMGAMNARGASMNQARPMEHFENRDRIRTQEKPSMNFPVSMSSGGITSISRRPVRHPSFDTPLAEDHVAMSSIPLTAAIMVRSQQDTNDLMIVWTEGDADAEEIQVSFARPAAKRALLTKDENRNSNSNDNFADGNQIPVSVNPKRENPNRSVPDVVQEITVKTEPKNTSVDAQFTNPRTHRASTPSVYRSLGQTMGAMNARGASMNQARPMEHFENRDRIRTQEKPSMNFPVSMSSGGITSISRRPVRHPSFDTPLAEDHVAMSSIPLTAAIMVRSQQDTNDLMIVWTESLDVDILDSVSQNSGQAILCIRQQDMLNLTAQQTERLKKSNMFTFVMLDDNKICTIWTVISFGEGHSPIGLKDRHFKQFIEVERIFVEHAHYRGMVVNNAMRGDGLLNLLRDELKEKKSVYNVKTI